MASSNAAEPAIGIWRCACSVRLVDLYTSPLAQKVIGCAIEVHATVGPGLLESTYQVCLAEELTLCGVAFREQVPIPIAYKGRQLGVGYRIDFLVEEQLVIELKAVEQVLPIHGAQVLTYLRLMNLRQGFLINFNNKRLVDGVKSFLNPRALPSV
jgi:GxxExxY protein